jgi:autotransporter-associated beta strand protein
LLKCRFSLPLCLDYRIGLRVLIIALLLPIFSAHAMAGTSGTWTNSTTGGLWSDPTNWAGGVVADGFDQIADFSTLDLTADNAVHLDSPRTIGTLLFGDTAPSNNWTLDSNGNAANALALAVSSGSPLIQVNNGIATINAVLTGSQGLTALGSGTLTLAAANTYAGVTDVVVGTLQVTNSSGSATGTGSVFVAGSLMGSTLPGQGFITGAVTINNGGKLLGSSGATLTLSGSLTLASGSSSIFKLSGTPNAATGSPLVATSKTSGNSLSVTGTHTINIDPSSTINVPSGMPYALYELYSYSGTPPAITSATSPFTGSFSPGSAPTGFNLGLFEGTNAAGTSNQVDAAVGTKPFVYLKFADSNFSTSFTAAGSWSNGAAPNSANNYIVSRNSLLSPLGPTATTFAGNSLTLGAGGVLGIQTDNGTVTTIPTLILNGGTVRNTLVASFPLLEVVAGASFVATSTSTFDAFGTSLEVTAPISGPGGLIINPGFSSKATVILTAANTYTGNTTVHIGTLQLGAGGSLPSSAAITLVNGSSSAFQLGDTAAAVNQTLSSLAGSGTVVGGNANVSTLTINNSAPDTFLGVLGGTHANQNNLALVMTGSSTLTLSGFNTYTGGTTVSGTGTLRLSGSGRLGGLFNGALSSSLDLASGVLDLNGTSQTVGTFTSSGAGGIVLNNGIGTSTLTIGNGNGDDGGNFAGIIVNNNNGGSGVVALTKAGSGTITLSGVNTYTGPTNVRAGTLALTSTTGLANTAITVFRGATFSVRPGAGTLTLGGSSTPSGSPKLTLLPGSSFDMLDGDIGTVNVVHGSDFGGGGTAVEAPTLGFEIRDDGVATTTDKLVVTQGIGVYTGIGETGAAISITALGSNALHTGTYPLITGVVVNGAGGFFLLTPTLSIGSNQYALSLSSTDTVENLIISPGGPPAAYWSGAQDANWNTISGGATNWLNGAAGIDNGALPYGGSNVVFTANSATNLTTNLGVDFAINSLTFTGIGTSGTSAVTISGNNLTINASAANGNAARNGIIVQAGSGAHTIASNVVLGGVQTWTNNSANPLTITGGISDRGRNFDLTVAGSGPIVLAGNNTYGGTTTVSAGSKLTLSGANSTTGAIIVNGTLNVNSPAALGSSSVTLNSGAVIDSTAVGGVTSSGTNTYYWSGNWSFGGTQPLNLGTGRLSCGSACQITLGGTNSLLTFDGTLTGGPGGLALTVDGPGNTLAIGRMTANNMYIYGSANLLIKGPTSDLGDLFALGLYYFGPGTLTLAGTNTYGGFTNAYGGTLQVTGSLANNGSNRVIVAVGSDFGTASIKRQVSATHGPYTGIGSSTDDSTPYRPATSADILAGANAGEFTGGSAANVSMAWRVRAMNEMAPAAGTPLISDVILLTGMTSAATDPSQTDPFALQMTYDPSLLGNEVLTAMNGSIYLGWLNPNGAGAGGPLWQNAIDGNFGNNATPAEQNFQGSFAAFEATVADTNIAHYIGAWGVDTANHDVWAVVNHNSQFAAVPEPGALLLMMIGVAFGVVACLTISLRRSSGIADG